MAFNRSGTQTHGDVIVNKTADGVDLNDIWNELTDAIGEYNKHRSAIASLLTYRTTEVADAIAQDVTAEVFEEATEFGAPRGISDPSYLKVAFDFRDWDLGLRASWRYLRDATAEQIENRMTRALEADNRLVTGAVLERLFSNVVRTNDFGLNVYGLYNGDGTKPPSHMGRDFLGTHTHMLTTQSLTLDSLDLESGITHLTEHGHGSTQRAKLILLIHPDDLTASKLTTWRAGVEYDTGKTPAFDFIPSSNAPARITTERVEGAVPPPEYQGLDVTGSYGKALIVESYFIPKGWCAIVATGGPNSNDNVIGFREHRDSSYSGLRLIPGVGPYPIQESFLVRSFGTGVRHRGAAVAIQITNNPVYAPPTIIAHR
ncbi:hypothetical protein [Mycobacterium attenuatum]|uniref:hypothetical protein n=1 Tax=Mycobacterium attenuatum TaxID=2341086 RepID=UPI000F020D02|nr:hypothetical protein [Mycobacterium attenuatum]VBA47112.1 hypothetical protein LAUMK41_00482 [Mycobacterium attenuatum]